MIHLHTNRGIIQIELDAARAPKTVENFLKYARAGFYDGTIFHRVINNFMIQGGGFLPGMKQKPTEAPIQNEAQNGLRNERGTLAMARTTDPHSATGQFFINVVDNDFLNHTAPTPSGWGYCVFGRVVEGMRIIDDIRGAVTTTQAGHQNVPVDDIIIDKVEIDK